mgnify:FL=1
MGTKISQMTLTGSAPATSEVAIAYNGENYKITPTNLVNSVISGGGGSLFLVTAFSGGVHGMNGFLTNPSKTYYFMMMADMEGAGKQYYGLVPIPRVTNPSGASVVIVQDEQQANRLTSLAYIDVTTNLLYVHGASANFPFGAMPALFLEV